MIAPAHRNTRLSPRTNRPLEVEPNAGGHAHDWHDTHSLTISRHRLHAPCKSWEYVGTAWGTALPLDSSHRSYPPSNAPLEAALDAKRSSVSGWVGKRRVRAEG
jgi:hypothetical protein